MLSINEIGILAFGTRIKRLYDFIVPQGKEIYKAHDLDFDPKWFTIVYALVENKELSVTDLSKALGLSHPAIIQNLKELEKNNWVVSSKSKTDGRIRLIKLSKKALLQVPKLKEVWQYMRQTVEEINREGQADFWQGFIEFETALMQKPWKDRVMEISGRAQRSTINQTNPRRPQKWFERKFDFDKLNTTPQSLIERLRYTPMRLKAQVKNMSQAQLTKKFPDNKWSIQENIGHINDLEPLWYGRVLDIISGKEIMREADLSNKKSHEAEHGKVPIDKILADFAANRKNLVRLCEENLEHIEHSTALHPRLLKPMRIIDLLFFVAEHDDHHIATNNFLVYQL